MSQSIQWRLCAWLPTALHMGKPLINCMCSPLVCTGNYRPSCDSEQYKPTLLTVYFANLLDHQYLSNSALYTTNCSSRPTLRTGIVITRVQSVVVLVRVQAVVVVLHGSKLDPHLRWNEWKIKFKNVNIKIFYIIYRAKILYIFTTYPRSAFTKILKIKMKLWRQFSNKTTYWV